MSISDITNYSIANLIQMRIDLIKWKREALVISAPFTINEIEDYLAEKRFPVSDEQEYWNTAHTEQGFLPSKSF